MPPVTQRPARSQRRDTNRHYYYNHAPECMKQRLGILCEYAASAFFRSLITEIAIARLSSDERRAKELKQLLDDPMRLAAITADGPKLEITKAHTSHFEAALMPHAVTFVNEHKDDYARYCRLKFFRNSMKRDTTVPFVAVENRIYPLKQHEYRTFCLKIAERQSRLTGNMWLPGYNETFRKLNIDFITTKMGFNAGKSQIFYFSGKVVNTLAFTQVVGYKHLRYLVMIPSYMPGAVHGVDAKVRAYAVNAGESSRLGVERG